MKTLFYKQTEINIFLQLNEIPIFGISIKTKENRTILHHAIETNILNMQF